MTREKWIISSIAALLVFSIVFAAFQNRSASLSSSQNNFSIPNGDIAVVYLYEPISFGSSGPLSHSGTEDLIEYIQNLTEKKSVKAMVLRINSPGGTVGASQELFQALMEFKRKTKAPIVVSIADIGASGAYWTALAGDVIFANPGSLVGSIGVIMTSPDFSDVQRRYGIGMTTYKSVDHKDFLSSWRKPTWEEQAIVKAMLADIQEQFVSTLSTSRKLTVSQAIRLADGRVYTGKQALAAKLIDRVGSLSDAIDYAAKLANIKGKPELIKHDASPADYFRHFFRADSKFPQKIELNLNSGPHLQ